MLEILGDVRTLAYVERWAKKEGVWAKSAFCGQKAKFAGQMFFIQSTLAYSSINDPLRSDAHKRRWRNELALWLQPLDLPMMPAGTARNCRHCRAGHSMEERTERWCYGGG